MKKNTPQLWNDVWNDVKVETFKTMLLEEENGIRWRRIKEIILNKFGSFENLKVIEIGSGLGTYSALMAKQGAGVTILDYADDALEKSMDFFENIGLSANFINCNALNLPASLHNCYDVSMSFGLTEHFIGQDRLTINKAHFDVLNDNGISFISVPNKLNAPYRLFKFIHETRGTWPYGEEYPYSRTEFKEICNKLGISKFDFLGESIFKSLNFLTSFIPGRFKSKNPKIKKENGTFLDKYFSYALVLYGYKPS